MTLEEMIEELKSHPGLTVTLSGTGVNLDLPNQGSKVLFRDFAIRWQNTYKRGKVKDNTFFDSVERQLRLHLIPRFGDFPLDEILPIAVHEYFCELEDKYTIETQHKIKVCLHELYDAAIENRLCSSNPVTRSLKLHSNVAPKEKHTWTQAQYDTAWQFAQQHPKGLTILVLMETALTRSEMLGLEMQDFDPHNAVLKIRNGLVPAKSLKSGKVECLHDGLKNTYRTRDIPFSPELTSRIRSLPREIMVGGNIKKGIPPHPVQPNFLFYSPQGTAWNPSNWFHRCYEPFMQDLCEQHPEIKKLTPHELRHTRASLLKSQGVDLYDLQKLLGHKDLTMLTRRYLHTDVERLRKNLNLCEGTPPNTGISG